MNLQISPDSEHRETFEALILEEYREKMRLCRFNWIIDTTIIIIPNHCLLARITSINVFLTGLKVE